MRMLSPFNPDWALSRRSLSPDIVMGDLFDDFDRIMDSFVRPTYANSVSFQPSCDIKETKDHYLVSFDMPGVKKEDIKVEIQNNQLVISGERQYGVKEEEGEATLRHERAYGKFERSFALPTTVNAEKTEAHYENGVLNISIPKAEAAKGRTIQIQSGQSSFLGKFFDSKQDGTKDMKDLKVS